MINRQIGDKSSEGRNLGNLGFVYQRLGQNEEALSHLNRALQISRQTGNKRGEGENLGNLQRNFRAGNS